MKTWVSKTFRTCEVITYNSVLAACDSLSDLLWEGPWEIEHAAMWLLTLESKEDAAYLFWCLRHIFSAIFIWTSFAAVDALLMLSRSQLAACFATTANNAKGDDGGRCYQWLGIQSQEHHHHHHHQHHHHHHHHHHHAHCSGNAMMVSCSSLQGYSAVISNAGTAF